ncbi:MAG TPA: hypothetical protein VEJ63_14895 [Planctomycetota bacterium]|nr:hypothetical protein [Planctomycetota bacterium]
MTSRRGNSSRQLHAFTAVELLFVVAIMALLAVMAVPSFARLNKASKVDQTIRSVLSTLRQARYSAVNLRRCTAIMYGDDFSGINPKPLGGVLPKQNEMQIWTVLESVHNTPYQPDVTWPTAWYPFRFQDIAITPKPISFPDGIRIVTGFYDGNKGDFTFWFRKTNVGEISRHQTIIAGDGTLPAWHCNASSHVLIWDVTTGEHAVILTGAAWNAYQRPRVVSRAIAKFGGVPLSHPRDITKRVDTYPGNM